MIDKSANIPYTCDMSQIYSDTDQKVEEHQIELLRGMPGWRKMEMLVSLHRAARERAMAGIRQRYPDINQEELSAKLAEILYGQGLVQRFIGCVSNAPSSRHPA